MRKLKLIVFILVILFFNKTYGQYILVDNLGFDTGIIGYTECFLDQNVDSWGIATYNNDDVAGAPAIWANPNCNASINNDTYMPHSCSWTFDNANNRIEDSTEINKLWNYGFTLFNTLYWVDNIYKNPQHLYNGFGLLIYADYKIYKNLYAELGIGLKKTLLYTWTNNSYKMTDLCMPLSIKYSFANKKPKKINFYSKIGILREVIINTKYINSVQPYYCNYNYSAKNIIKNTLFYKYESDLNNYYGFINIGMSFLIFQKYKMTTEIEYLTNNGQKNNGVITYQQIQLKPNNVGLKIGVIF